MLEDLTRLDLTQRLDDDDDDDDDDDEDAPQKPEQGEGQGSDLLMRKLLKARTIMVARPVSDKLYEKVVSQLTLLEADDAEKPITVYINSPGGSADSGFAIYDALRFAKPPVRTVVNGICASAAVMIYLGGDAGTRYCLPNGRFLLHQPSTYSQGQASDLAITAKEIVKLRELYNQIVAEATGKKLDQVNQDADRDFWLSAQEAVEYGLVDKIVTHKAELDA